MNRLILREDSWTLEDLKRLKSLSSIIGIKYQDCKPKLIVEPPKLTFKEKYRAEIENISKLHLNALEEDLRDISGRIDERKKNALEAQNADSDGTARRLPNESEHDYLLRTER